MIIKHKVIQILLSLTIFLGFTNNTYAQNYTQAVGIRGGDSEGATYRLYKNETIFNEVILMMKWREMKITYLHVLSEQNAFNYSNKLYLLKGYGAHLGYGYGDQFSYIFRDIKYENKAYYPVIGFDAYIGLEYRVEEFPFILGLDAKPYFEFSTRQIYRFNIFDISLNLKYQF